MNLFNGRDSYAAHLAVLTKRDDEALAKSGFEHLLVGREPVELGRRDA